MKIKFNFDDNVPLNKILKFHILAIIFETLLMTIFEKDGKYYQIFLDDCNIFYRIYISNIYVNKSNYKSKKCDFTITGIF